MYWSIYEDPVVKKWAAERALKASLPAMLERDHASGLELEKCEQFWWQARDVGYRADETGVLTLLNYYELADDVQRPEWTSRGGRLLGVANQTAMRKLDERLGNQYRHSHALVLPLFADKGPLRGFIFMGLHKRCVARRWDRTMTEWRYTPHVAVHRAVTAPPRTLGAWGLDTILRPRNAMFPDYETFITAEPLLGLWLQIKHLRRYGEPLPLLVLPPDLRHLQALWEFKRPENPIIITRARRPQLYKLAAAIGGRVAVFDGNWQQFTESLRRLTTVGWLRQITKLAVTGRFLI